jgi:hypothetical protein
MHTKEVYRDIHLVYIYNFCNYREMECHVFLMQRVRGATCFGALSQSPLLLIYIYIEILILHHENFFNRGCVTSITNYIDLYNTFCCKFFSTLGSIFEKIRSSSVPLTPKALKHTRPFPFSHQTTIFFAYLQVNKNNPWPSKPI